MEPAGEDGAALRALGEYLEDEVSLEVGEGMAAFEAAACLWREKH